MENAKGIDVVNIDDVIVPYKYSVDNERGFSARRVNTAQNKVLLATLSDTGDFKRLRQLVNNIREYKGEKVTSKWVLDVADLVVYRGDNIVYELKATGGCVVGTKKMYALVDNG